MEDSKVEGSGHTRNPDIELPLRFAYAYPMSFAEILEEIPNLSFAQRQELVRRAIAVDEDDLTPEENALLDARMEDFRRDPEAGIPLEQLREHIAGRLSRQ
jgi:hypothetical protein